MSEDENSDEKDNFNHLRPTTRPLLAKLRTKFFGRENNTDDETQKSNGVKRKVKSTFARPGNTNALKRCRKIQIGLKVDGRHIRKESTGGGRREAKMDKMSHKQDIMSKAMQFFFQPDNQFGDPEEFTFDLENFEEKSVNETDTIQGLYESTGLPLLRFYLSARSKEPETDDDLPFVDIDSTEFATIETQPPEPEYIDLAAFETVSGASDMFPTFIDLGTPTVQGRVDSVFTETVSVNIPIINDLGNYEDADSFIIESNDTKINVTKVRLHRGHVLKELTEFFVENDCSTQIEVEMVMPDGKAELAEDFGGLLRDALSEFWEDFYNSNTLGEHMKIPCLRDSMTKEKWQATAKVLVMGYRQEGFFPYKLALPFLKYVMDGDDTIINQNHQSLVPAFLEFIPESEKEILKNSIEDFESVDKEDLYDVLENYKVKRNVTKDNIRDILQDAAHRTIIQSTSYVCRCWHGIFVNHLKPHLGNSDLEDICEIAVPTTKRVVDALSLPEPVTVDERNTIKLLVKFIRSLTTEKLMLFMRYTTGASQMLGKRITVRFVKQNEFERRPVAHTCGCILELATSFNDFIEFRTEFTSVLESKIWVMDIV